MYQKVVLALCLGILVHLGISLDKVLAAQPVVILSQGEYVMGTGETMEVAEERAMRSAVQSAAEKAGAFVKSYTKVKNLVLETDAVEVIANHSMKVEVIDRKKTVLGDVDAIRFYVKIRAIMTEEDIEANLKKIREDMRIVDAYNRLKADYEKQSKEMEHLKRQLVGAPGVDRKKITRLISEEETKFKANLWIDRAQHLSYFDDEALNAYKKALELNPKLAQAYVGIADVLRFHNMGEPSELEELEKKVKGLQEALADLDKAVSMDENYADAYAMRVDVLGEIKTAEYKMYQQKDKLNDFDEKQYDQRILKDINRSIALNASNKADMYKKRAYLYVDKATSAEYERSSPEIIKNNFDKALADINQAIALCKAGDSERLIEYYGAKVNIYNYLKNYYIRKNDTAKENEYKELANRWYQKAEELAKKQREQSTEEENKLKEIEQATEIGRLSYYLEFGWREKVFGSRKDKEGKSDKEKEKIVKQRIGEVKNRISTGTASAEEYLLMAMFDLDDSKENRTSNYNKVVSLLEKRNPEGREALLLVQFYIYKSGFHFDQQQYDSALNELKKAETIADKYLIQSKNILSIDDYWKISKAGIAESASSLNREAAEALYWIRFSLVIPSLQAKIYEKLDLTAKAIEEYRYLCGELKDEVACKDWERLK